MLRSVIIVACVVLIGCTSSAQADNKECYSSGQIAGIVIASVVVTIVLGGLAAAFLWYLWKRRQAAHADDKSIEKPIMCPPMSPDKQMIASESNDYAFDNPYFKDDETVNANVDAAEKGETGFRKDNGDATPVQNAKPSNGTTGNHHKKSRPFSSLPFHAVFHPSGKKQQRATTMDDTYISKHLERITVPLRGHDFTGLGFNVCGNMRDGIFVKDVLHRGPASESGKIKAGDRIVGVYVSFAAMVYEDALTILSYASPYDVRLEIEKSPSTLSGTHLPSSSPKRLGASTSFRNNGHRQLFHPLYRSQSIDDLTQIGKDGFGVINTSGSQRDSNSSATPKRSQSVEASNSGPKTRPSFVLKTEEAKSSSNKGSRKSSTSSCESTAKAVTPTEKSQPVLNKEPCTKKEVKSARFRTEQVNVKTEAPSKVVPPVKPAREVHEDKQPLGNDVPDKSTEVVVQIPSAVPSVETVKSEASLPENVVVLNGEIDSSEKPTVPPRKLCTPKRKAPAPPPNSVPKTETSALVHQEEELQKDPATLEKEVTPQGNSEIPPAPSVIDLPPPVASESVSSPNETFTSTHEIQLRDNDLPMFSSAEKIQTDPGMGSSDTSSLASADHASAKMDNDQNSSPGKRKASSLGDLTKLDHGTNKKTSISSAILERAVSLDFQQSIPGENLTKQKKVLRAPAFEDDDDYLEDREDLTEMNGQGLKRWDDGLDKVFTRLTNGDSKLSEELSNEEDDSSADDKKPEIQSEKKLEINYSTDIGRGEILEINPTTETVKGPVSEINHITDTGKGLVSEINHIIDTGKGLVSEISNSKEISSVGLATENSISTEISAAELENDSPVAELPLPNLQDSIKVLTSTPVKRIIEVKNFPKDDDDDILDDVPYLASSKQRISEEPTNKLHFDSDESTTESRLGNVESTTKSYLGSDESSTNSHVGNDESATKSHLENDESVTKSHLEIDESSTKYAAKTNSSPSALFSPVTISIPVIKPDLTHFEKLPSPPPANTHPTFEPSWRINKTISTEEGGKTSLERISVHSLYKPIFTSKEINNIDEPILQTSIEKMVNGNESDASEHYSTAQENTSTSSVETSSLSVTLSTPVTKEVTKTPNTIAGFAKTLIIPGPNEVENLLSLAAEPNTPPPSLEPSAKPIENE